MLKQLINSIIILLIPSITLAAPVISSVSGNATHDQSLTISSTGTNFGTGSVPIKWDDFDDGTDGNGLATGGYWTDSGNKFEYDDDLTQRHSRSTMFVKKVALASGDAHKQISEFTTSRKKLISAWYKIENVTGSNSDGQTKVFNIEGSSSHATGPGMSEHAMIWQGSSDWNVYTRYSSGTSGNRIWSYQGATLISNNVRTNSYYYSGYWQYVIIQYEESTLNTSNGNITVFKNIAGPSGGEIESVSWSNVTTVNTSGANAQYVKLRGIRAGSVTDFDIYYDDVYIADTWARVEIGDNDTYANCTHREMQIPSAWASDEITITVNQGSFENGTAYLFVVDSNGDASSGHEITLGGTIQPQNRASGSFRMN